MYQEAVSSLVSPLDDPTFTRGGLRTGLVSKLTGLPLARLRYWHKTGLLLAQGRSGQRGVPRIYSWVDYLRLRIAADLVADGIHTTRVRRAIDFLDENLPDWYRLPIRAEAGHVMVEQSGPRSALLADKSGQRLLALDVLNRTVEQLTEIGPLGKLHRFDDAVTMNPAVNLGLPVLRGTSLETEFVAHAARGMGVEEFAKLYELRTDLVARALEFEEAAA